MIQASFKGLKLELNPQLFNEAIQAYGVRALWKRAMMCWCFSTSGSPNPLCPDCHGDGILYINSKEIRVLGYSSSASEDQDEIGVRLAGTCTITVKPEDPVGFKDMLVFPDFRCPYSEFIDSEKNPSSKTTYPMEDIISVRCESGELELDTDFGLSEDNQHLVWAKDTNEDGVIDEDADPELTHVLRPSRYSILYTIKPVYIVIDVLKELRGTFVKDGRETEEFVALPKQFLIKKDDFGRRVEE